MTTYSKTLTVTIGQYDCNFCVSDTNPRYQAQPGDGRQGWIPGFRLYAHNLPQVWEKLESFKALFPGIEVIFIETISRDLDNWKDATPKRLAENAEYLRQMRADLALLQAEFTGIKPLFWNAQQEAAPTALDTMATPKSEMMVKLEQMIVDAGGTASAAGWENETQVMAFSKECFGDASYGHPRFTASYNKETKWLAPPTGQAFKLEAAPIQDEAPTALKTLESEWKTSGRRMYGAAKSPAFVKQLVSELKARNAVTLDAISTHYNVFAGNLQTRVCIAKSCLSNGLISVTFQQWENQPEPIRPALCEVCEEVTAECVCAEPRSIQDADAETFTVAPVPTAGPKANTIDNLYHWKPRKAAKKATSQPLFEARLF